VLWAEDARVFVTDAMGSHPFASFFMQYAGYMHLFPRTAAQITVALFPLEWAAYVITIIACGLGAAIAAYGFFALRDRMPSIAVRLTLWFGLITLPIAGIEVNGSIANSHWYLIVGLFFVLVTRQRRVAEIVVAAVIVCFAVMSDPLTGLLLPLVVVRIAGARSRRELWIPGFYVGALMVQLAVASQAHFPVAAAEPTVRMLARTTGYRVFLGAVAGQTGSQTLYAAFGLAAIVAAIALIVGIAIPTMIRPGPLAALTILSLGFAVVYFVVPAWLRWYPYMDPDTNPFWIGSRYSVVPISLVLTALAAVAFDWTTRLSMPALRWAPTAVVAAILVVIAVPNFGNATRTEDPSWATALGDSYQTCATLAPTDTVEVNAAPQGWYALLRCDQIPPP
jgi:hypothetical protein